MIARRAFLAGAALTPLSARAQVPEPRRFDIPESATRAAAALPNAFRRGARNGVALVEFFDYNCPWCRRAAPEIEALIASDPRLRVMLVNHAILGEASVAAAKIAIAVASDAPETFPAFHRDLMAARGTVGGEEALAVAARHGVEADMLAETGNSDGVAASLAAAARFGADLGLTATPAWLVGRQAFVGYLAPAGLRAAIAAARSI